MSHIKRLHQAIDEGGSVLHNGEFITDKSKLPSAEELASATGKTAIRARETTAPRKTGAQKVMEQTDDEEE